MHKNILIYVNLHNNNRHKFLKDIDGSSRTYSTFAYDDDTFANNFALGENLGWLGGGRVDLNSQYAVALGVVQDWWNENLGYTYSSKNCSIYTCGHYTAMALADTRYIGCGATICSGNFLLMCNYYPAGNINGVSPYTAGTPCSECSTKSNRS